MKRTLLYAMMILFSCVVVQAQCGPGEDTEAPVFGNAGDGTMSNPFKNLLASTVGGVPSGTYYFNFNGSTFQGVLDNDTDGGGWLMVLNYVHLAGDNTDLTIRNTDLPLLGSSTLGDNEAGTANWGHMGNALAAAIDFEEVRFYGVTTGHSRVIDFKTSFSNVLNYLKTGLGSFGGIAVPSNFTTLPGHTANIPGVAFNTFASQGDQALTEFPFWRGGQFHWGIRGLGNRWEVDDFAVNTQSTIHRVWVRGDLSPAATTSLDVTLDNTGNITVNPADFGLTATDNCSTPNLSLSQTDFDCTHIGNNAVQLTATDDEGNSSVLNATIVVSDSAPVINVPPPSPFIEIALDSNGEATVDLTALNTTVTDDCGIMSTTISQTDFTCADVGFRPITITATDVNGNTTQNAVFVNVVDNEPPVIQCVAPFSVELDATGSVSILPDDILDSATDNCGISGLSLDKSTFTCADIGDNLVTLTVTDRGGNDVTCTTTITVTIPSCPGNLTLEAETNACGVTYNYPCASNITAGPPSGTFLNVGSTTTFTYDTLDNTGATVACSYDVTVVDTQGPIFNTQDITLDLAVDATTSIMAIDLLGPDPLASDYTIDQTGTLDRIDISSTGTSITLEDDQVSTALPIGFEFGFYGNIYSDFYISSNGFITFTANGDDGCCDGQFLPNSSSPNNLIAFDWDDLSPEDGGTIRFETIGTAPNRILIVDFDNVAHADDSELGSTTQVKLFETTNRIEIHATSIDDLGYDKTQGLENIDGTAAIVVPGRNAAQWSVTNDVVAFTPVQGILDGCGVASLVASQTDFNCNNLGSQTITLTAIDNNGNMVQKNATVTIEDTNSYCSLIRTTPKVFLQGAALNPNMGAETLMRDDLRAAGHLPTISPYDVMDVAPSTVFDVTGPDAIVDWVWIELRDASDNTTIVKSRSALLQRDGDVVDHLDGVTPISFDQVAGDYYIAITHRNHLSVMTGVTIGMSNITSVVDLSDANNDGSFGSNALTTAGMPSNVLGMWAGDANNDGELIFLNTGAESVEVKQRVLDVSAVESPFGASVFYKPQGYYDEDVNMDGEVVFLNAGNELLYIKDNILAHPENQVFNSVFYKIVQQLP